MISQYSLAITVDVKPHNVSLFPDSAPCVELPFALHAKYWALRQPMKLGFIYSTATRLLAGFAKTKENGFPHTGNVSPCTYLT